MIFYWFISAYKFLIFLIKYMYKFFNFLYFLNYQNALKNLYK